MANTGNTFFDDWDDLDGGGGGSFGLLPIDEYAFEIEKYEIQTTKSGEHQAHFTLSVVDSPEGQYDGCKVWYNGGLEGVTTKGGTKAFATIRIMKEFARLQPRYEDNIQPLWSNIARDENGLPTVGTFDDGEPDLEPWTSLLDLMIGGRVEGKIKHTPRKRYNESHQLVDTGEKSEEIDRWVSQSQKRG